MTRGPIDASIDRSNDRPNDRQNGADTAPAAPGPAIHGRWPIAIAGLVALAVAMGIGRFAFTPLLPMMLADGSIDLHAASWLASANYLGYLAGALLCTFQPWISARIRALPPVNGPALGRGGLVATGLLTIGMALPLATLPSLWALLRFAAGVASAVVFVYAAGWSLAQLARRGAPHLGGVIFVGPGAGIVVSGLFAWVLVQWHMPAWSGWAIFGVLAWLLSAAVWKVLCSEDPDTPGLRASASASASPSAKSSTATASQAGSHSEHGASELGWLAAAYGIAGFGYIITATFLPVIARTALPGSPWLDMFWPILGFGVMVGALLSTRVRMTRDMRLLLAACYAVQAAAIALTIFVPTLAGFAFGSLMLGIPFTTITFFAVHEVRRIRPVNSASYVGLITAIYGIGQIVGPPLAGFTLRHSATAGEGFAIALEIAIASLLVGSVVYLGMWRAYPMRPVA